MSLPASQSSALQQMVFLGWGAIALLVLAGTTGCEAEKQSALDPPGVGEPDDTPEVLPTPLDSASDPQASDPQPPNQRAVTPTSAAEDDRLLDKTFDDLKFDIEPGEKFEREMLTDEVEALLGKRIRIRGYILPTFTRKGLTQFILVRDDQECCFGPGAALYDCIVVEMQPGKSADFSVKPVAVEGRLTLEELMGLDDVHLAIFHLDGESVE